MHKPCIYAILTWPILYMILKTLKGYLITSHAAHTYKFPITQKYIYIYIYIYRHSQVIPSSLWHNFKKLGNIKRCKRDPSNIQPATVSIAMPKPSSPPAVKRHQTTPGRRLNVAWDCAWDNTWMAPVTDASNPSNRTWTTSECRVGRHLKMALQWHQNDAFWSPTRCHWLADWRPALLRSPEVAPEWHSSRRHHLLYSPTTPRAAWLGAHNSAKAALLTDMRRCLIVAWTTPKTNAWMAAVTALERRLKCALNGAWTTHF